MAVRCWSIASSISSAVAYSCVRRQAVLEWVPAKWYLLASQMLILDGDVDERQHDVGGQAGLTDGLHLVFDGGLFRLVVV